MLVIVSRGTSPQEVAVLMRAMAGDLESKGSMVGQIRKGQGSIHLIETSGPTVISRLREAADRWDGLEEPFGVKREQIEIVAEARERVLAEGQEETQ